MSELQNMMNMAGFHHVQTYIQSGNIVFESDINQQRLSGDVEQELTDTISSLLQDYFGKEIMTLVITAEMLGKIIDEAP